MRSSIIPSGVCALLLSLALPALAAAPAAADDDDRDAAEAAAKAAKDLHRDASRRGEIWTALQIEAWAARQDPPLRISSLLGRSSQLYGDAYGAFPHRIHNSWDWGDRVGVLCHRRYYLLSSDRRPLALPVSLPFWPDRHDMSADGRYLGIGRLDGPRLRKTVHLAIIDLGSGEVVAEGRRPLDPAPEEHWDLTNRISVADDGSAVAMGLSRYAQHFPSTCIVRRNDDRVERINGVWDPAAVGPKASWLVVHGRSHRDWDLLQNGKTTDHLPWRWESNSGLLIYRKEGKLWAVQDDQPPSSWMPSCHIGDGWGLDDYGRYLAIDTGRRSANTLDLGDFMALPGDSSTERFTYLYRWSDLTKNLASPEAHSFENNRLRRADAEAQGVLSWQGPRLYVRDISGDTPREREIGELPGEIRDAWSHHHYYKVRLADGDWVVVDTNGRELWRGQAADVFVQSRRWILVRDGENPTFTWRVIHLHPDPEQRKDVRLQLEPANWWTDVDALGRYVVANQGPSWHKLDISNGKSIDSASPGPADEMPRRRPGVHRENNSRGRFYRPWGDTPRLFHKAEDYWQGPGEQRWNLADAFMPKKGMLFVLDRQGEVFVEGRKGFTPLDQTVGDADHFCTDSKGRGLYIGNRRNFFRAEIVKGPNLNLDVDHDARGQRFDDQGWRIDVGARRFSLPNKGGDLVWKEDELGFRPRNLHAVSRAQILVVTDSLVFALDTRLAGKMAAKPDAP